MSKDPELAAAVNQKMRDYIQKGYIRRLSASEAEDKRPNDWFLPIFPVTNPNKPGKIRMVFDAAAKFREFRVAVVGDIREMFHQVLMRREDQRSQMILWDGNDQHGDSAVYVVTVMTFGAACSPSSAQFVKNLNAERFEKEFPCAAKCIKDEHYVDDMLVSVETEVEQWRWIPTKWNVADDGTKWTKTPDLSPTSRWFNGPRFLWGPESLWPAAEAPSTDTPEELRPNVLHHTVQEPLINFHRFSKWRRLLRAVAYVVRFVTNVRRAIRKDVILGEPLTQEELARAEKIIITQIQADVYACEIRSLKKDPSQLQPWKSRVEKSSPLYKLSPVLDEHGIVRMRGRLAGTLSVSETLQQPIILPRKHRGTELLILSYHERYKHCNHRTVVSELRARFYIPRVLCEYNRVRKSCQRCKIDGATPEPPSMGNVPFQRVAVGQRAFSFTGVDYFGPLLVAVGRRVEKIWGVIFTCLTSRAIHLEMAHSLTTASCIMAIRRFIARRGKPLEMISDRGTNFVGSARELEEALQAVDVDAMMDEFVGPEMKWSFNPPAAPHFGGCWERLVRSVKKVLSQFELPRKPTDEVLMSTLTEIEFIINSRPLTYVPLDDEMDTPITPNHLLLGSSNGCKQPAVCDDSSTAVKSAWRAAQHNADVFWRRWVSEYLPTLTRRSKWFESVRPIQVGDIVVIVDNCLPRNSWPKGRVIDVVRAQDGQPVPYQQSTNKIMFLEEKPYGV
ncbi:uncharacterized protein LOC126564435 [Anopheles maculipalpis]|uniref:uncharacterized protein LOC126564435 n=1 Tax=Anopheles maculipalpis TaxID=1496333 RepID=UPI00215960A3|nr:uncharacterized protein LOC126564435 [Anopheles maculipalpis]